MTKSMWAGVLVACTLVAGCGGNSATRATSSAPTTTPTIAVSALRGLLLTVDQVNAAMGAQGMTVTEAFTKMWDGHGVSAAECQAVSEPDFSGVYAGSGWGAVGSQVLREPEGPLSHYVDQTVVLFATADQASAFYKKSAQSWQGCVNRRYTATDPEITWEVGPVNDSGGMLTAVKLDPNSGGWRCQHA